MTPSLDGALGSVQDGMCAEVEEKHFHVQTRLLGLMGVCGLHRLIRTKPNHQ